MPAQSAPQDDLVVVGRVLGVFGIQGWVKVFSYTREPQTIGDYREWCLKTPAGGWQPYRVVTVRAQGRSIVAQLNDVTDREGAAALIGRDIAVPRKCLPALPVGEYYWTQLEGLRVINTAGVALGTVGSVLETGANDVLVVQGDRERLIPYIMQVVQSVDIAQGVIRVEWDADF